jgi:hypothetical protein
MGSWTDSTTQDEDIGLQGYLFLASSKLNSLKLIFRENTRIKRAIDAARRLPFFTLTPNHLRERLG